MPSWTIVPEAIATSTACEPQAFPAMPMSMPWSSVHDLGASTRDRGCRGKTSDADEDDVVVGAGAVGTAPSWAAARTAESSVLAVLRPTVPLGGLRRLAVWNRLTAVLVREPKYPSAATP